MQVLMQPALLSSAMLIGVAGLAWTKGFLDGLRTFILRDGPGDDGPVVDGLYDGRFDLWGPGKIITINLSPAIIVLAFPTSKHLPDVYSKLHLVIAPITCSREA